MCSGWLIIFTSSRTTRLYLRAGMYVCTRRHRGAADSATDEMHLALASQLSDESVQLQTVPRNPPVTPLCRLREGDPTILLQVLHYVLLDYSPHVAGYVHAKVGSLYAKDDASFTDACFRLSLLHLGLLPQLNARQFLSSGFVGAYP